MRQKIELALAIALVLVLIFWFSNYVESIIRRDAPWHVSTSIKLPTPTVTVKTRQTVRVIRVVDGDTIEIEGGQKVRYIGMDTPETVKPKTPAQCFGKEASNRNKELVEGKTVELEKDVSETDKYGRLLRYVWLNGTMVNEELVNEGYARMETVPPDVKYASKFLAEEQLAKVKNLGLWNKCHN